MIMKVSCFIVNRDLTKMEQYYYDKLINTFNRCIGISIDRKLAIFFLDNLIKEFLKNEKKQR